jgi:hypothetical protein
MSSKKPPRNRRQAELSLAIRPENGGDMFVRNIG